MLLKSQKNLIEERGLSVWDCSLWIWLAKMKWTDYRVPEVLKTPPPKTNNCLLIYKCNRDISMNTDDQIVSEEVQNPFKNIGFIKFWIVSTVFWFSFPASLVLCYFALGSVRTKQFVRALVHDFLQTLFIILVVVCIIISTIYHYVSRLF